MEFYSIRNFFEIASLEMMMIYLDWEDEGEVLSNESIFFWRIEIWIMDYENRGLNERAEEIFVN